MHVSTRILPYRRIATKSLPASRSILVCRLFSIRAAFRSMKYLRTKFPSRPGRSAPHDRHVTSWSTVSGPRSALTTWYNAWQFGHVKELPSILVPIRSALVPSDYVTQAFQLSQCHSIVTVANQTISGMSPIGRNPLAGPHATGAFFFRVDSSGSRPRQSAEWP